MKTKRVQLIFSLLLVATLTMAQKGWEWDTYLVYDLNNNFVWGARLSLTDKAEGEIVVPETMIIKGKELPVVCVTDAHKNSLKHKFGHYTKVVLPSSIHEIELRSESLTELVFKEGPYFIERLCINSPHIKKIVFPKTVKRIKYVYTRWDTPVTVVLPEQLQIVDSEAFWNCNLTGKLVFPPKMQLIDFQAFKHEDERFRHKALEEIVLPKEIDEIGAYAFADIKTMKTIVLPDKVKRTGKGIFDWTTWDNISSHSGKVPDWVTEENCSLAIWSWAKKIRSSYSFFLERQKDAAMYSVGSWQKRGEFETVDEWKQRVNEESRKQYVARLGEELRQQYINEHKPTNTSRRTLLTYDIDNQLFPIKIGYKDTIYVKVDRSEAQAFKANFKEEYVTDLYDIVDDYVAIVGVACKVGDKTYETTTTLAKADKQQELALDLPPLDIDFAKADEAAANKPQQKTTDRTIDQNIPATGINNANTFAVIIGNENYPLVAKVPFARNDAQVFAEYCRKTLGMPDKNVRTYGDATYAMMMTAVKDIQNIAEAYNGDINIVFYYAGHGIPGEQDKDAYLLPVDADGRQTSVCYPVSRLYQELAGMNARSVVVLMDACFSGATRGDGMLMAARGVAIKAKPSTPQGKMVVMTAANGDETAFPYEEKGHGMFTYFLLKKLRETKGNCTLGELGEYVQTNVRQQSVVVNRKPQTPTVSHSPAIADSWQMLKMR